MTPQEQEIEKIASSIEKELKLVFEANMKIFDWDIPENDEKSAAKMIIAQMEEALKRLKAAQNL